MISVDGSDLISRTFPEVHLNIFIKHMRYGIVRASRAMAGRGV